MKTRETRGCIPHPYIFASRPHCPVTVLQYIGGCGTIENGVVHCCVVQTGQIFSDDALYLAAQSAVLVPQKVMCGDSPNINACS